MERFEELTQQIKKIETRLKNDYKQALKKAQDECKENYNIAYKEQIIPLRKERDKERKKHYRRKYYRPLERLSQRDKNALEMFGKKFKELEKQEQNKVDAKIKRDYLHRLREENERRNLS